MKILNDFQTSVTRALSEISPKWRDLPGLIVCGTHSPYNIEVALDEIKNARESGLPFLGICFGYQLAAIEYARNVLGITDATTEEVSDSTGTLVVRKRKEGLKVGLHDGENWWSYYEVDPLIEAQLKFPSNFFTAAFHPEYGSSIDKPHPILVAFLKYAAGNQVSDEFRKGKEKWKKTL